MAQNLVPVVKAKAAVVKSQVAAKAAALWSKSKAVAMSLMVAASLSLPAFATDGGGSGGSGSTGMAAITSAADTVATFINKAFDIMTSNPLLAVYLASGLLGVGIYKFRQFRKAAH